MHTAWAQQSTAHAQVRLAEQQTRAARVAELRARITVNQRDAAELLGISEDSFVRHVRPKLRSAVDLGPTLYQVAELERLVEANAREVGRRGRR